MKEIFPHDQRISSTFRKYGVKFSPFFGKKKILLRWNLLRKNMVYLNNTRGSIVFYSITIQCYCQIKKHFHLKRFTFEKFFIIDSIVILFFMNPYTKIHRSSSSFPKKKFIVLFNDEHLDKFYLTLIIYALNKSQSKLASLVHRVCKQWRCEKHDLFLTSLSSH